MPHPKDSVPVPRRRGFSLVLSLTVMAMLLLLCIGAAALLTVELRVSRATASYAKARLNAMAGARIAFGEIQRLLGPDQRVSATADILCASDQTDPRRPAYYTNPSNGQVVHPRWVGVWNSGRIRGDATTDSYGSSIPAAEATKVIQRTSDGYLIDSRFSDGKDWRKDRAGKTPVGVSKRFEGWLVSGNEATGGTSPNALTPFTDVATPGSRQNDPFGRSDDVVLAGAGSLGTVLPNPSNRTDGDYLGARAARVGIPVGASQANGSAYSGAFAYWVSDEGVKARINLADKFENITPSAGQMNNGGMARLLIPQRFGFTAVQNPTDPGGKVQWSGFDAIARTGTGWSQARSFDELALIDKSMDATEVKNYYWNDITFDSAGIYSDTINGGLRKDLSAYFNSINSKGIADSDNPAVPESGITDTMPLLTDDSLKVISPKLGLLYNWYTKASLPASAASETATTPALSVVAPGALSVDYNIVGPWFCAGQYKMATPSYANPSNSAPLSPVVTRFDMYFLALFTPKAAPLRRNLMYPRIDLWNPYSVPIQIPNAEVAWATQFNFGAHSGPLQFNSIRPLRQFKLGTVTLAPGQSISYVPVPGQNIAAVPHNSPTLPPAINMVPGTAPTYYIDRHVGNNGSDVGGPSSSSMSYFWQFKAPGIGGNYYTAPSGAFTEFAGVGPMNQVFLLGGSTPAVLQQINFDPWCALTLSPGSYPSIFFGLANGSTPIWDLADVQAGTANPLPDAHIGFRLTCLDDASQAPDGISSPRNTNSNPFVNYNFRAPRYSRHPFDGASLVRVNNYLGTFALTTDHTVDYRHEDLWPTVATQASPYLSYAESRNASASAKQFAILDVPRQSLGFQSLSQLQSAPLVLVPWAPGIPFGNALTPIQAQGVPDLYARTGYSKAEENTVWGKVNDTPQFNNSIRQQNTGTFPWTGAYDLSTQRTLIDWSYELNHGLWDAWMTSGISSKNIGWTGRRWDLASLLPSAGAALNSRFADTGVTREGGYFGSDNFKAYRAAYTLVQKGSFNVNSTSVVAWEALLGAFRGIQNPTRDGKTNSANQTPFSRHLIPVTGPMPSSSSSAPYDQTTWGGFRALDDDELRALAVKIVEQVKQRGPFLSLSDFVNRRLIPAGTGDYGDLSTNENNFLGAIQAAINEAGLNKSLGVTSGNLYLDRSKADAAGGGGQLNNPRSAAINPITKVKDKLAGTPGYLLQSDVLQKIAPVLSARSDTFKIRAKGESDEGAEAYVEITVQRTAVPLVPDMSGVGLPINPKAISATVNPAAAGNQFFGRRMQLVSLRWLSPDEI